MSQNEFCVLCNKYNIHPAIAIEDKGLVQLLKTKQYEKVEAYLRENF